MSVAQDLDRFAGAEPTAHRWQMRFRVSGGDFTFAQAYPPVPWPGVTWMPCGHRALIWRLFHG